MIIIPAIDIIDNQVVRLEKGNYDKKKVYSQSVLETARLFEEKGFDLIHIVDLIGSKKGEFTIENEINDIKKNTRLKIQSGGGIRKFADAEKLFEAGIDKVVIGSLSVKDKPEFEKIVKIFTPEKIIVASDVREKFVAVKGWTETTEIGIEEHIRYCTEIGIEEFLITDISRDGMLNGPAAGLYSELSESFDKIKIIASGGVSSIKDLINLKESGLYASVVGRAIYENKINLEEMKKIAL